MNILIIEDDINKYSQISAQLLSDGGNRIVHKLSYQSGLKEIVNNQFDLILLDMSLPTFDTSPSETGGPFLTYAGSEILNEMEELDINAKVIVITQFESFDEGADSVTLEQLTRNLMEKHRDIFIGTIYYSASQTNWKHELNKVLAQIGFNND